MEPPIARMGRPVSLDLASACSMVNKSAARAEADALQASANEMKNCGRNMTYSAKQSKWDVIASKIYHSRLCPGKGIVDPAAGPSDG